MANDMMYVEFDTIYETFLSHQNKNKKQTQRENTIKRVKAMKIIKKKQILR